MSAHSCLTVKNGVSFANDEGQAVQELHDQIYQTDTEAVIFFCSSRYDMDRLGTALKNNFSCSIIGCTTAGEITSTGYHEGSIVGVSIATDALKIHPRLIFPLSRFTQTDAEIMASSIREKLTFSPTFSKDSMFGLLLIDGMSMLEERTSSFLHSHCEGISIIGGSAGDDMNFIETKVYADGRFISDAAVFAVIETSLPFYTFRTQHFQPSDTKLVITEADPVNRRVMEINGAPAAREYAEVLGLTVDKLTPTVFSQHPVMLSIGGEYYVRSIQKVNDDDSLSFYCAIDNGLVLTIGEGIGLVDNLNRLLMDIKQRIPNPQLILGCDCILRRLEIQANNLLGDIRELIRHYNFVGFSTYGEQVNAIHVNQTLTGVAIGDRI